MTLDEFSEFKKDVKLSLKGRISLFFFGVEEITKVFIQIDLHNGRQWIISCHEQDYYSKLLIKEYCAENKKCFAELISKSDADAWIKTRLIRG